MLAEQKNKVKDFLLVQAQFYHPAIFLIGAIIAQPEDRGEAVECIRASGLKHIIVADQLATQILEPLFDAVQEGKGIVLEINDRVPSKIMSVLEQLYQSGRAQLHVEGEIEPRASKEFSRGSFVILLMTPAVYDHMSMPEMVTAVCNIA